MIQIGINTRVGPICRTVEDAARVLDVIAGYDPKDELTAFTIGRMPSQPYESFAHETNLRGLRIGVVREYMNKTLFTKEDEQTIDLVSAAAADLGKLGATIVDPGPARRAVHGVPAEVRGAGRQRAVHRPAAIPNSSPWARTASPRSTT